MKTGLSRELSKKLEQLQALRTPAASPSAPACARFSAGAVSCQAHLGITGVPEIWWGGVGAWPAASALEAAAAAIEAACPGALAEVQRDLARLAAWQGEMAAWRAADERRVQSLHAAIGALDASFRDAGAERVWVREGRVQPGHHSRNFRDGRIELGASVFPAWRLGEWIYVTESFASSLFFVPDHLVVGEPVGEGSDGEPVVTVTSCRRLTPGELAFMV